MIKDAPCSKCGSARVVPRARVVGRGHQSGEAGSLRVGVPRRPEAWLFKHEEAAEIHARVCGDCGFTELYIEGAELLYRAYEESSQAPE